jgi:hypothetical protein
MSNKGINSKEDFLTFLGVLLNSFESSSTEWSNKDIPSYLRAARGWADDMEGYYKNIGEDVDLNNVNWRVFADILTAAKFYE